MQKEQIADWFRFLQDDICRQLAEADGVGTFEEDHWERPGGGGGRTRVIQGKHIEKGGVNFSAVYGNVADKLAKSLQVSSGGRFFATGVSIVLHPSNPWIPIIHMNVRYFELDENTWWFGGGIDLTPHYINPDEARFFHQSLKKVCDGHHPDFYARFKRWADDYFFLKHREETRGIGGIFFDRLHTAQEKMDKKQLFDFVQAVGLAFCPVYIPLLQNNKNKAFTAKEQQWQLLRRGRYVEFNLVWDQGTKFGLDSDGRTESILMSLPPAAHWVYNHQPEPATPEAATLSLLKKGIDWLTDKGA